MDNLQCIPIQLEWTQNFYSPAVAPFSDLGEYPTYEEGEQTKKCLMNVFVQGNLEERKEKPVFLTVHDIGQNHETFAKFVCQKGMEPFREGAIFLHVCVPGQEPNAEDFVDEYPTMYQLGDGLAQVLAKLKIDHCIGVGEGAGADILCQFAMNNPSLVLGLVLIHCTSTTHGILEHIKEILSNLRLNDGQMNHAAWNYLLTHKYGNHDMDERQKQLVKVIEESRMNLKNLSRYIYSFAYRSEFTDQLKMRLSSVDVLLVTGGKSSHIKNVEHMFENMTRAKTGLLIADGVVDLLEEAPAYLVSALILICQRLGLFAGLLVPILNPWNYVQPIKAGA